MSKFIRVMAFWCLAGAMIVGVAVRSQPRGTELMYSEFLQKVERGELRHLTVRDELVTGTLANDRSFWCRIPRDDAQLHTILRNAHVPYAVGSKPFRHSFWGSLIFTLVIPIAFFGLLWRLIYRASQTSNGECDDFAPARVDASSWPWSKTGFENIACLDTAKEQLREILDFLHRPEKYQELGARIPHGVLLVGPPGCGKTLLMRATAGEAGVPCHQVDGSQFRGMRAGIGAWRIRNLFATARTSRPCLVFIDHLDAIGSDRRALSSADMPVANQTVQELAAQMDGFQPNFGVIVIAATHRPELLDPMLLRPGRFDRIIRVEVPEPEERLEILKLHLSGKPMSQDVDLPRLCEGMIGLTGADIANVVNEAALGAVRAGKSSIETPDFETAVVRIRQQQAAIGKKEHFVPRAVES